MTCEIHKNAIGILFKITIKDCNNNIVDLAGATTKQIIFKKPNGELLTKDASFLTDGEDGIITYTTIEGDLDVIGTWKIQAFVEIGPTSYKTDIQSFRVYRNLE